MVTSKWWQVITRYQKSYSGLADISNHTVFISQYFPVYFMFDLDLSTAHFYLRSVKLFQFIQHQIIWCLKLIYSALILFREWKATISKYGALCTRAHRSNVSKKYSWVCPLLHLQSPQLQHKGASINDSVINII